MGFSVKKLTKSRKCEVPAIVLRREDLQDLLAILAAVADDLQIRDHDFEFGSLDELLQNHKGCVNELSLESSAARFELSYNKHFAATFSCRVSTPEEEALFLRTREFLFQKRNRWNYLLDRRVWMIACLFGVVWLAFLKKPVNVVWLLPFLFLVSGLLLSVTPVRGLLFNSVSTSSRGETVHFWQQNKEKILLALISALIGGTISCFFSMLK